MKSLIQTVVIAAAFAAPVAAFAQQSDAPLTRAQVRAQLVQLEQAGFHPGVSDPHYPADVQAAQARVDADNAVGGVANATATGVRATEPAASASVKPVYFGQ